MTYLNDESETDHYERMCVTARKVLEHCRKPVFRLATTGSRAANGSLWQLTRHPWTYSVCWWSCVTVRMNHELKELTENADIVRFI